MVQEVVFFKLDNKQLSRTSNILQGLLPLLQQACSGRSKSGSSGSGRNKSGSGSGSGSNRAAMAATTVRQRSSWQVNVGPCWALLGKMKFHHHDFPKWFL
jgi:hypothetical protein